MQLSKKWRFFGIANYILSVFYFVVFAFAMKAFFNPENDLRNLQGAKLLTACIGVIFLNSCLNIYIFHRHLPERLINKWLHIFYRLITIVFTAALLILLKEFIPHIPHLLSTEENTGFRIFLIWLLITLILAILVLVLQIKLPASVTANHNEEIRQEIENIGEDTVWHPRDL